MKFFFSILILSIITYTNETGPELKALIEEVVSNEKDIKQVLIRINDEKIPFSYKYKFPSIGNYTIKYIFPHSLEKASYIFCNCKTLKKADLSNFNTCRLKILANMFDSCSKLEILIFFNSPIEKVTDMNEFLKG